MKDHSLQDERKKGVVPTHTEGEAQIAASLPSEMAAYLMFDNSFLRYCSHCFH
jgi:hypothetical protein